MTHHQPASTPPGIRPVTAADLPHLARLIDATGLFPSAMLTAMTAGYLRGEAEAGFWLTLEETSPVAVACCAPERMTAGAWNLLLIAVHPERRKHGHGAALVRRTEAMLKPRGGRLLLVETSGLAEFEGTRHFYRRCGYEQEARIRDYYDAGEDKIVFRKVLATAA